MTLDELAVHNTPEDCWVAISGTVYDVTAFLASHPGGRDALLALAGRDATAAFQAQHPAGFLAQLPASCRRGALEGAPLFEPVAVPVAPLPPLEHHLNVDDFEASALQVMDTAGWTYYSSGAEDERTLAVNRLAYERWWFRPHVLVNVANVDTSTTVLGAPASFPLYLSASAMAGMAHPEAEVALAGACFDAGVPQMVPTIATKPHREIAAARADGQTQWFQLYVGPDRGATEALLSQAEDLGFAALFVTVDTPYVGRRERDFRNRFASGHGVIRSLGTFSDPALTWDDVDWLRGKTRLPLVLKGVQRGDDALRAVQHGVAGVVVSNHGGRQLDGARATLDALVEIRDAVGDRLEVLVDGGVRRGADIVKAVALGARAVGVSRAALYGLATYGREGAAAVFKLLRDECKLCMALNGAPSVKHITRDLVVRSP